MRELLVVPVIGGRPMLLQKPRVAVTESLPVPVTDNLFPLRQMTPPYVSTDPVLE